MIGFLPYYSKGLGHGMPIRGADGKYKPVTWNEGHTVEISQIVTAPLHDGTITDGWISDELLYEPKQPKRLRCQYCGRIAMTERPTCEGCGAVLPWEMSYEE